jgi:calcineurin-like phosphoesterase family protein
MKIKFNDSENSKLFVTGCLHLNHDPKWDNPIYKMRGYKSSEEMTESIITKINNTCQSSDVLLVLGDFCLNTSYEKFLEDIEKINPKLWFINGNHNNPWEKAFEKFSIENHGHVATHFKDWLGKINILGSYIEMSWNKKFLVANHYAFRIWNKSHHGAWSLVSHSHGTLPTILPEYPHGKQLDCGWDVHGKPLCYKDIKLIMDKKTIDMPDHHNENTN